MTILIALPFVGEELHLVSLPLEHGTEEAALLVPALAFTLMIEASASG